MDEPNFSSKTAQVGDPFLCHVNSIEMFGRPLVPRGAYLSGRLEEYKDPGHFVGKGWLQLEFTSLTLPTGNYPLHAKVIAAGHYHVNAEGKIQGHGHPTRDAVEWMIPVLWPIKVLTLPARGPRPALKGETRVELRLMEDMLIPEATNSLSSTMPSRSVTPQSANIPPSNPGPPAQPALPPLSQRYSTTATPNPAWRAPAQRRLTLLVLRDGPGFLVVDYWVVSGRLEYTTGMGAPQAMPLEALDIALTRQLNAERGVPFALVARNR
jgi:hypothetical protein